MGRKRLKSPVAITLAMLAIGGGGFFIRWVFHRPNSEVVATTAAQTPEELLPDLKTPSKKRHKHSGAVQKTPGDIPLATVPSASTVNKRNPQHFSMRNAGSVPTVSIRMDESTLEKTGGVSQSKLPPLELNRVAIEDTASASSGEIHIDAAFESATAVSVQRISPTHFRLSLNNQTSLRDWFMFRIAGACGKTIRIDVSGEDVSITKWSSLNPVYTTASNLDDPETYSDVKCSVSGKCFTAWNGPILPATDGQKWHFISDCWVANSQTYSFVQLVDQPSEVVAMRIPYLPGYNHLFLERLSSPCAQVIEIGRSEGGRPLQVVKISSGGDEAERHKPCVLVYAGEHADEQDAMWAANGIIESLVKDDLAATSLREQFTFLVIPMLDPDASSSANHSGMIANFLSKDENTESIAYANWFQSWVNSGRRLDLVFDLHNVQSNENPQISCALLEGLGTRGRSSAALHQEVLKEVKAAGFIAGSRPWERGWSPDRLGGWLSRRYGPITLTYELNSEAAQRHLNLAEVKSLGTKLVMSVPTFMKSANGLALLADVDHQRQERLVRWSKNGAGVRANAIDAEAEVSRGVGVSADNADLLVERWMQ